MIEIEYNFRPFVHADLSMLARWLRTPEVVRWWGNPEEQEALVTEDLDQPLMRQWIVEHAAQPFAYAQAYNPRTWPEPHFAHLAEGAMVIDTFIGEPAMVGGGHGRRFLRHLADMLLAEGAPIGAIDPDADNRRAQRAYAAAGFVADREYDTEDGGVVVMLYTVTPSDA